MDIDNGDMVNWNSDQEKLCHEVNVELEDFLVKLWRAGYPDAVVHKVLKEYVDALGEQCS